MDQALQTTSHMKRTTFKERNTKSFGFGEEVPYGREAVVIFAASRAF